MHRRPRQASRARPASSRWSVRRGLVQTRQASLRARSAQLQRQRASAASPAPASQACFPRLQQDRELPPRQVRPHLPQRAWPALGAQLVPPRPAQDHPARCRCAPRSARAVPAELLLPAGTRPKALLLSEPFRMPAGKETPPGEERILSCIFELSRPDSPTYHQEFNPSSGRASFATDERMQRTDATTFRRQGKPSQVQPGLAQTKTAGCARSLPFVTVKE